MQKEVVKDNDVRLDVYLSGVLDITRSKVIKMVKEGKVLLNNKKVKAGVKVFKNDAITYELIDETMNVESEDIIN